MAKFRMFKRGARAEWRIAFLGLLMMGGIGVLVARLWWHQVARGEMWASKISSRSQVTVRVPAVRGEIQDRNGTTLVANRASYEVDFYLPDMVHGFRKQNGWVPKTQYKAPVRQMLTELSEADIVQIVNSSIIPRLHDLDLAKDYNSERLRKHYRNNTLVPFTYLEELDFPTIAKFSEHDVGLPGVDISIRPVRQYVYGALGAHLLGYVGAPKDLDKLPDIRDYNFYQPDVEGLTQVEAHLDKYIRGKPGVRIMERNVKGTIDRELKRIAPQQGNNVQLTIDARIEYIAEKALRDARIGRGAAVVVNPENGDILAMASVPSYDPNRFIPSISKADWDQLNEDDTDPLTNRAIQGYAPGSTFKTVSALAGLRKGLTGKSGFNCSGGVTYGTKFMKCWVMDKHMPPHGGLTLPDALKFSCNAFFYQWGNAAKIENIESIGDALGLGRRTGVPLTGESPGILPGPDWLRRIEPNARWSDGYTANVSIGQGSVEASPLQMAMVTATIANGGISYQPRLIHRILDQSGRDLKDEEGNLVVPRAPIIKSDLRASGISEEQMELVRRGMWKVVNEPGGTGKKAHVKGIEVAGKTGTAQFWREVKDGRSVNRVKDNHTWFICFAPYNAPKFAVCVFVQGAKSGGGVSAPIAQRILEESLALEKGFDPGLKFLAPAVGSFAPIEEVDYKKTEAPRDLAADLETADHADTPDKKKKEKQINDTPSIRANPDQGGKVQPRNAPQKPQVDKRGFFERFFGPKKSDPPRPAPAQSGRTGGR